MVGFGTSVIIGVGILSLIGTWIIAVGRLRPSKPDREETINRRLGNDFGPGGGRYGGDDYTMDFIKAQIEEQYDLLYRFIRLFYPKFYGITIIKAKVSDGNVPEATRLESYLSHEAKFSQIEVTNDEITYVINTTDPRRVQDHFDALRSAVDELGKPDALIG